MTSAAEAPSSPARRALAGFARLSSPSHVDIELVMRCLAEHDDWYVPVRHAEQNWGQSEFGQTMTLGPASPSATLTVFTDLDSLWEADGHPLGRYGGPIPGARVLGAIGQTFRSLVVNPASPGHQQWYIAEAGFGVAAEWADTVLAERALSGWQPGREPTPATVETVRAHRGYHLLVVHPENSLAQITVPAVAGMLTVAFTAADRFRRFRSQLAEAIRPAAGARVLEGPQLFNMMTGLDVAGLVLNAGGDDQRALMRPDLSALCAVRATDY